MIAANAHSSPARVRVTRRASGAAASAVGLRRNIVGFSLAPSGWHPQWDVGLIHTRTHEVQGRLGGVPLYGDRRQIGSLDACPTSSIPRPSRSTSTPCAAPPAG